jgi:AcrR family transcriptional regulator
MIPAASQPSDTDTRRRLLESAGEVFGELGFRAATVRDICQRAGANVAAVNYHFGDKQKLYQAVLEQALRTAIDRYPPTLGLSPGANAEQRLRAFIHSFLLRMLADGVPAWFGRMMAREMIEPTGALDGLVDHVQRPLFERLRGILAELLGDAAEPATVILCAHSVVAQCVFYRHCQAVVCRMTPDLSGEPRQIDAITEHITRSSLAAIRAYAQGKTQPKSRPRRKRS